MINYAKSAIRKALTIYTPFICKVEFKLQQFRRYNERPVEYGFVFRKLGEIYPRHILDVGTGTTALPHLMRNCGFVVFASDNIRDFWPSGTINRHYYVINDDITNTSLKGGYDLITCISTLEHIKQADIAVKNMFSLLNPGGSLLLSFPYNEKEYVANSYDLEGSTYGQGEPYVTQIFSRKELDRWVVNNNCQIVEQEYWQFWEGGYWTVGKQIIPPKQVNMNDDHQITCLQIMKN